MTPCCVQIFGSKKLNDVIDPTKAGTFRRVTHVKIQIRTDITELTHKKYKRDCKYAGSHDIFSCMFRINRQLQPKQSTNNIYNVNSQYILE